MAMKTKIALVHCSEILDLKLDPLVLWGDVGVPVDLRLQQADGTLQGGHDDPQQFQHLS